MINVYSFKVNFGLLRGLLAALKISGANHGFSLMNLIISNVLQKKIYFKNVYYELILRADPLVNFELKYLMYARLECS